MYIYIYICNISPCSPLHGIPLCSLNARRASATTSTPTSPQDYVSTYSTGRISPCCPLTFCAILVYSLNARRTSATTTPKASFTYTSIYLYTHVHPY